MKTSDETLAQIEKWMSISEKVWATAVKTHPEEAWLVVYGQVMENVGKDSRTPQYEAERTARTEDRMANEAATDGQLKFINDLGGDPDPYMTKLDASRLIDRLIRERDAKRNK